MYKELNIKNIKTKEIVTGQDKDKYKIRENSKVRELRSPQGLTYIEVKTQLELDRKYKKLEYKARGEKELKQYELEISDIEYGIVTRKRIKSVGSIVSEITYELSKKQNRQDSADLKGREFKNVDNKYKGLIYKLEEEEEETKEGLRVKILYLKVKIELYSLVGESLDVKKTNIKNKIRGLSISSSGVLDIEELFAKCYRELRKGEYVIEIPEGVNKLESKTGMWLNQELSSISTKVKKETSVESEALRLLEMSEVIRKEGIKCDVQGGYMNLSKSTLKKILPKGYYNTTLKVDKCNLNRKDIKEIDIETRPYLISKSKDENNSIEYIYICKIQGGYVRGIYGSKYTPRVPGLSLLTVGGKELEEINEYIDSSHDEIEMQVRKERYMRTDSNVSEAMKADYRIELKKILERNQVIEKLDLTREELERYMKTLERDIKTRPRRYLEKKLEVEGEEYCIVLEKYN